MKSAPELKDRAGEISLDGIRRDYVPEEAPVRPIVRAGDGWSDPAEAELMWAYEMARWHEGQRRLAEIEARENRSKGGQTAAANRAEEDAWIKPALDKAYAALQAQGYKNPGRDRLSSKVFRLFKDDPRVDQIGERQVRAYLKARKNNR